jgi:glycosyltransferase involved in cell wall biosynthesis
MLSFDIGIAPIFIKKEEQSKKGTFKLVQYMSLGLVSIVTDLPYTRNQIKDGYNGYLVQSNEDWTSKILQSLRLSGEELNDLGKNAYNSFYKSHHIDNQYPLLRDFYKEVAKLN